MTKLEHRYSARHRSNHRRPYPNAADPRYFLDRFIDCALAVATGMGTITIIFFLATM